jgi:hypothetical protein
MFNAQCRSAAVRHFESRIRDLYYQSVLRHEKFSISLSLFTKSLQNFQIAPFVRKSISTDRKIKFPSVRHISQKNSPVFTMIHLNSLQHIMHQPV